MLRSAALSISGTISNIPENIHSVGIVLESGPRRGKIQSSFQSGMSFGGKPDGRFNFGHLTPGFYRISAFTQEGGLHSQTVEMMLINANAENIDLALAPGLEVTGVVELSGPAETGRHPLEKQMVRLKDAFGGFLDARSPKAEVAADGSFVMKSVAPGRYRVLMEPLPDHGYIKTVRLNGVETPCGIIELESGGELKITLSANGAQISGTVESTTVGEGSLGRRTVVLAPGDLSEITSTDDLQFSYTGPDGKYNFPTVAPGRYKLGVVDWTTTEIAEEIKRYGDQFLTLEVKEGDRIVKDLKPIKKEDDGDTQK